MGKVKCITAGWPGGLGGRRLTITQLTQARCSTVAQGGDGDVRAMVYGSRANLVIIDPIPVLRKHRVAGSWDPASAVTRRPTSPGPLPIVHDDGPAP